MAKGLNEERLGYLARVYSLKIQENLNVLCANRRNDRHRNTGSFNTLGRTGRMVTGAARRGNQGRRERDEGGTRGDWQDERREQISKQEV